MNNNETVEQVHEETLQRIQEKTVQSLEENDIHTEQFVTFKIGKETYGVEVLRVQEIIGMTEITVVPNTLVYMKGVINLRGTVVPVVDMRIKFGMPNREYDEFTVIIIVEVDEMLIGMIVDTVSDVLSISRQNLQDTPHFSSNIETDYISSIGHKDETMVIVLNVDRILTQEEIGNLKKGKIA